MTWFTFNFHDFTLAFLSVLFEGIPFLLLGSLISGVVDVFVSPERIDKMLPRNPVAAVLLSGLLGLIFPMCECGSVIVIRRFIKKGVPLSCAVTYMLGAPIVSPIVAFSTYQAFAKGDPFLMAALRLSFGYVIAVTVGLIVRKLPPSLVLREAAPGPAAARRRTGLTISGPAADAPADFSTLVEQASTPRRVLLAVQSATADFMDVTFFFVIGVAITSLFNTGVHQALLAPLATSPLLAIMSLMILASLLGLCSTTDAFVAWTFTAFPPQAKLAFMVFGAMFNLKLVWLYGLVFRRTFVVAMSIGIFVAVVLLCSRIPGLLFR